MPVGGIRVVGLRELRTELRRVEARFPRELRQANLAAAQLVADEARRRALAQGGVAAKTAPSIKALAQQRGAQVRVGGARYPFSLGAEFGAIRYRQFEPWTGNQWTPAGGAGIGYFLHPTVRALQVRLVDVYGDMLDRAIRRAFPKGF